MKYNISDLLDHLLDGDTGIPLRETPRLPERQTGLNAEHIKEATLKKIHQTAQKPRGLRHFRRGALIAAILALALSATALAAIGIQKYESPGVFFQSFFGNEGVTSGEGVVEYAENGQLKTNLPAWERVEVDETLADELIGGYINGYTETAAWENYTLSVEASLYDPATGTGLVYYSVENPDGFPGQWRFYGNGIVGFDYDHTDFDYYEMVWTDVNSPESQYLDSARSSDTKWYFCSYYIITGEQGFGNSDEIEVSLHRYDPAAKAGNLVSTTVLSIKIPVPPADLPGALFSYNGAEAVTLSPIGIRVSSAALGLEDPDKIDYLALEYDDGSLYVVLDGDGFVDNSTYGLIPMSFDRITWTFNRLVDTNRVVRVLVNDMVVTP
ncbi:MAG: hypothetical protein LBT36_03350 [Oscillospiraceae bacterium]|jgi:hypothetical protein|nr:hypothetical protein [Oscillospiraceae bacterium]